MTVNVVCMKWGSAYDATYVNKLFYMVKRNLPIDFRFICITDDSWGIVREVECVALPDLPMQEPYASRAWKKLLLFSKNLGKISGKTLFLDLDIVIVDKIDCFFTETDNSFHIIKDWGQREKDCIVGNSSVFLFEFGKYPHIFEDFAKNMELVFKNHRNEQTYISRIIKDINFWPEEWVRSYKSHCFYKKQLRSLQNIFMEAKIPSGAKIIAFHGNPKPHQAMLEKFFMGMRVAKGAPWVAEHWK